jgi:vacuolar protein-sorting-associated protein 4
MGQIKQEIVGLLSLLPLIMSTLLAKAIQHAKQAADDDRLGNREEAFRFYVLAVEYLRAGVKYEKSERRRALLTGQCQRYLERAEELKKELQGPVDSEQKTKSSSPSSSSNSAPEEQDSPNSVVALQHRPSVHWDDIAGLFEAKRLLQETIIMPRLFPHLFGPERKAWSGILLYGPPGTGKSYLAKAVATEAQGSAFFSVSSADLVSKWVGESEKQVHELFESARASKPAVIFMDEIDSLGRARGGGQDSDHGRRLLNQLLTELDGVGNNMDGVLFLAATNMPWELDPAIRRRFQKRIYIPLPNALVRAQMFKIHMGRVAHPLEMDDFHRLALATENFSGSDIQGVVREALMMPLRMIQDATHFWRVMIPDRDNPSNQHVSWTPCSPGDLDAKEMDWRSLQGDTLHAPPLTFRHFQQAADTTRATVSLDELDKYSQWTQQFGHEG